MKNISKILKDRPPISRKSIKNAVLADPTIRQFIQDYSIPEMIIDRDLSELHEYYRFKKGRGLYRPQLCFEAGYISVINVPRDDQTALRLRDGVMPNFITSDDTRALKGVTFDDVELDDYNTPIIQSFKNLAQSYEYMTDRTGVWIEGEFGRGKSYIMSAFAYELYTQKNAEVYMISVSDLIDGAMLKLNERGNNLDRYLQRYKTCEVLILDDIGTEHVRDFGVKSVIYEILNYRMNYNKFTCFTSNLTQKEYTDNLKGQINDALDASRLLERLQALSKEVRLLGKNWRTKA